MRGNGLYHGMSVPYATLTRLCRERAIGVLEKMAAGRIVTGPGKEMQHDTSPARSRSAGRRSNGSVQALGGTCGRCMSDNSRVVIVCGTGKNAQVSPEMEVFEKPFGFTFIESNCLTGRTFKDDADLNRQAH